ncbi:hypothetical protein G7051_02765 [Dysgonomonas sp. HDW5B]|uniref:hypothetical protein n=1 Tax=Dysgonomonas sp. HDW5B TaxID=2714927 RepID=UPI00140C3C1C|nr:hypothetical protein [Dysgonomonas sp. HDW5B]QIK53328.1 hypothetical protein G7051_02765 [Dysgonomonas sp. HDW5B]
MKHLYIFFCFLLLGCSNNITISSQTSNNNIDTSSDFYFRIYDGASDRYNSKTGSFTRTYLSGSKTSSIILSDDEKESVYKLYKAINFKSFPPKFEIDSNSDGIITSIMPSFETSLQMCEENICKKVVLDFTDLNNPINDKDKALEYKKLYDKIWQIIKSKEEYQNIQESDLFYL